MSVEQAISPAPISVSAPLHVLFDRVGVNVDCLEEVMPSLDLTPERLNSTHIHLGHRALFGATERVINGQCLKILPEGATQAEQNERANYLEYLIPGIDREEVDGTTFVLLDLPGIAMVEHFRVRNTQQKASNALFLAKAPDVLDIERSLCSQASRTLIHELLHVPIEFKHPLAQDENAEVHDSEEAYISAKLMEIGEEGVPRRLVNLMFRREFDVQTLYLVLAQIADYRGWLPKQ